MKDRDRERVERCLSVVDAYLASGRKAGEWAPANGVSLRDLSSWAGHADRWRARLRGEVAPAATPTVPPSFVGLTLPTRPALPTAPAWPTNPATSIRVEWPAPALTGIGLLALHWPISHARELAAWLRELCELCELCGPMPTPGTRP